MDFGTDSRLGKILLVGAITITSVLAGAAMYYVSSSKGKETPIVPVHSSAGQPGITYDGHLGVGTGLPGLLYDLGEGEIKVGVTSNQ